MPTLPPGLQHLAHIVTRSQVQAGTTCSVVIGGTRCEEGPDGLPLSGHFFEMDVEEMAGETTVIVARPIYTMAVADLPSIPKRGDTVEFDDGPYTVLFPVQHGGSVDLHLQKGPPGRVPRR